jgi:hypothetical protein
MRRVILYARSKNKSAPKLDCNIYGIATMEDVLEVLIKR